MLVPKKNRLAVYSFLFKEGVIVTKKDHSMTKHPQLEVPNLHVCKLLQSLKSRAVVTEKFNWQYLYYTLTDDGIEYLRNYLHVSEETVPATLKKPSKPQPPASFGHAMRDGEERGRGGFRGGRGGRGGYRGPRESGEASDMGASRGGFASRGGMASRGGRGGAVASE